MKIYITNNLVDEPTGGGNQFLKALKKQFKSINVYVEDPREANIILFNSHQEIDQVLFLKKHLKEDTKFVHRIDGPMRLYNNMSDERDLIAYQLNNICADAVIFQSKWSRNANLQLGLNIGSKQHTVIVNAVDDTIFNAKKNDKLKHKIKIIASSWSSNIRKGFNIYKYLDDVLDFEKYEFSFMGRSPYKFNNIRNLGALRTELVAKNLQNSDIFITASENDPCSNSLIEAMSCSLPAIALRSGGHPEIVKNGGVLFEKKEEIIDKIEELCENYVSCKNNIIVDNISQVADKYLYFFENIM